MCNNTVCVETLDRFLCDFMIFGTFFSVTNPFNSGFYTLKSKLFIAMHSLLNSLMYKSKKTTAKNVWLLHSKTTSIFREHANSNMLYLSSQSSKRTQTRNLFFLDTVIEIHVKQILCFFFFSKISDKYQK